MCTPVSGVWSMNNIDDVHGIPAADEAAYERYLAEQDDLEAAEAEEQELEEIEDEIDSAMAIDEAWDWDDWDTFVEGVPEIGEDK